MNYSEISKELGLAVNTIKAWVNALEVSGLVILLPPYYRNLGKRLIKAPKLYFCDNGLLCALLNIDSLETLIKSLHPGSIWENFVMSDYLKEGLIALKDFSIFNPLNGPDTNILPSKI